MEILQIYLYINILLVFHECILQQYKELYIYIYIYIYIYTVLSVNEYTPFER